MWGASIFQRLHWIYTRKHQHVFVMMFCHDNVNGLHFLLNSKIKEIQKILFYMLSQHVRDDLFVIIIFIKQFT